MKTENKLIYKGAFAFLAILLMASFSFGQTELITNGDFEDNSTNFAGWNNDTGTGSSGCDQPWVQTASVIPCLGTAPVNGSLGANTAFDGFGPTTYILSQQINLPSGITQADLSWAESYQFDIFGGDTRTFSIDIYDAANTTLLVNLYSQGFSGTVSQNTLTTQNVNVTTQLAALTPGTVTIRISAIVPGNFTGPAAFTLDDVSLLVTAGQAPVPTLSQWGLILLALVVLSFGVVVLWKRQHGHASA